MMTQKKRSKGQRRSPSNECRPAPPPPPPASLVNLIQTDESVLRYFQSLQENLQADVNIWKNRANKLKEENTILKQQVKMSIQKKENKKSVSSNAATRKRKTSDTTPSELPVDSKPENSIETSNTKNKDPDELINLASPNRDAEGRHVNDSDHVSESSSDDIKANSKNEVQTNQNEDKKLIHIDIESSPKHEEESIHDSAFEFDDDDNDESSVSHDDKGSIRSMNLDNPKRIMTVCNDKQAIEDSFIEFNSNNNLVDLSDNSDNEDLGSLDVANEKRKKRITQPFDQECKAIFDQLLQTYNNLEHLGISLIDVVEENTNQQNESGGEHVSEAAADDLSTSTDQCTNNGSNNVNRRSDDDVVTDLMHCIHSVSRLSTTDKEILEKYPLFVGTELLPCCNLASPSAEEPAHPAFEVKKLILQILICFEVFCSSSVPIKIWDSYFTMGSCFNYDDNSDDVKDYQVDLPFKLKCMKIGLRGRQTLAESIVNSLEGEASGAWACFDRATREATPFLHFVNVSDTEEEAIHNVSTLVENDMSINGGSKSQIRLATIIEHIMLSQILICMLISRNELQRAARTVLKYLVSTVPVLKNEEYPKMPPVLSLSILEAMIFPDPTMLWWIDQNLSCSQDKSTTSYGSSWFTSYVNEVFILEEDEKSLFALTLDLTVQITASIFSQRKQSTDDRIHDTACVELASYRRLIKLQIFSGSRLRALMQCDTLFTSAEFLLTEVDSTLTTAMELEKWLHISGERQSKNWELKAFCLQMLLLLQGDTNLVENLIGEACQRYTCSSWKNQIVDRDGLRSIWMILSHFKREQMLRRLDSLRSQIFRRLSNFMEKSSLMDSWKTCRYFLDQSQGWTNEIRILCLPAVVEFAANLSDGETAVHCMYSLVEEHTKFHKEKAKTIPDSTALIPVDMLRYVSCIPVLRVINLEKRKDRLAAFIAQACRETVLVIKAVAPFQGINPDESMSTKIKLGDEFGHFAFDGTVGRLAEAHEHLVKGIGSLSLLNKLVSPHWRPHDLKPFDRNAPDSEHLVRTTPSELACALSHICSWKGVVRSLRIHECQHDYGNNQTTKFFRYPHHVLRLFKISGFAEGPALLATNRSMPPAPVCVIMEDDAILCDRFTERLASLLRELPRDFQFCSLGYSRPKTAPIVPYSTELGIPSMVWYLTGYCISLSGAEYLLASLPVVGPVDSFIGLKMTNNWDNSYGVALGVGNYAKAVELPPRKILSKIMQFRAFCALHPLCSQKYNPTMTDGAATDNTGRGWRHRDTDIEYSGDNIPSNVENLR